MGGNGWHHQQNRGISVAHRGISNGEKDNRHHGRQKRISSGARMASSISRGIGKSVRGISSIAQHNALSGRGGRMWKMVMKNQSSADDINS